jgi:hypothetical protein
MSTMRMRAAVRMRSMVTARMMRVRMRARKRY